MMELLQSYGAEFVFGIPGVHTLELYRGIATSGIRHITPRHEQSAGFMADGYARATGRVGVCCLITGPGITNAATALAQAYSDSVPILAVSSVNKTDSLDLGQGDLHELAAQQKLTSHFTAFSQTILDPESIPEVTARAYAIFNSERPRPVHIEIPIDLIENQVHWNVKPANLPSPSQVPDEQLRLVADKLMQTKDVAIILGGGCKDAANEARECVELLNLPVVTTFAGKGIISEDHPLSLGANLLHQPILDFLKDADLVLAIGTQLSETDIWSQSGDIKFDGHLIRIDIDPAQVYQNAVPDLGLIGDAKHALSSLTQFAQMYKQNIRHFDTIVQFVEQLKQEANKCWSARTHKHASIWDQIRNSLPDNGIVTADSTQLVYSGNYYYPARLPRTYLTSTTGYGTLGYALPAAIGAKLGKPDSPVVCVIGDGGLMFTIQELATAVEHQLPIVILLWNNDGYGEIRDNFNRLNIPLVGVDLESPDFLTIAKGFGCNAARVNELSQLPDLLRIGFKSERPTLLEIRES